jgi:hypothetical protein
MELRREHFECIKEENSEEEDERQWEKSKIVFDHFCEYLKNKGLKESTSSKRTKMAIFFIMDYLFVYDDIESILEVSGDTIRTFLGNWYIRKFLDPRISEIKSFLRSILDFFTFLQEEDFVSEADLAEIRDVCKDVSWFEMRLRTYRTAEGHKFHEWIEEYNYDW